MKKYWFSVFCFAFLLGGCISPDEVKPKSECYPYVQVGDVIEFEDGDEDSYYNPIHKGVVFYCDGNGHGLAAAYTRHHYSTWSHSDIDFPCIDNVQDTLGLLNPDNIVRYAGLGSDYTQCLANNDNDSEYYYSRGNAAEKCLDDGSEWYLPSLYELWYLLTVANCGMGGEGPIAEAGVSIYYSTTLYWTSDEYNEEKAWYCDQNGNPHNAGKASNCYVIPIRAF